MWNWIKKLVGRKPVPFDPAKFGFVQDHMGDWQYGNKNSLTTWSTWVTIKPSVAAPEICMLLFSGKHVGHMTCTYEEAPMLQALATIEYPPVVRHLKLQARINKINSLCGVK